MCEYQDNHNRCKLFDGNISKELGVDRDGFCTIEEHNIDECIDYNSGEALVCIPELEGFN